MDALTESTPSPDTGLDAALLQAVVIAALAALCGFLYSRYRKPYFRWWAGAWTLYLFRIGAIATFLVTRENAWLYWHQVLTGWTALALLYAALVFSQQTKWRTWYFVVIGFPLIWSYIAVYRLSHLGWAPGPAVAFLSLASLWTAWAFYRYRRQVGASGATVLAAAFGLWGLHHLDYPFLRNRGAWVPWGYYLDTMFALAVGLGIMLLVLDDLRRGLGALSALSGDLQRPGPEQDVLDALLARPRALAGVRGTALYLLMPGPAVGMFARGVGACDTWTGTTPSGAAGAAIARVVETGRPLVTHEWGYPYAAILPILRDQETTGALVLVGDARDPFTALDERFLVALGQQVGAALENADLYRRLEARTVELARLSARMVEQHEDERRRLSRELHDETAQVFSAVKMELGVLRDTVQPAQAARLDQVLDLIDDGIRSIRNVTNDLRPSLLDDLGLLPALRSLVTDFSERSGVTTTLSAPAVLPPLSTEAELALFRALQEALANVARHADASAVDIALAVRDGQLHLQVRDNGRGPGDGSPETFERNGHMGLTGMRERISALGGRVQLAARPDGGAQLDLELPLSAMETR